MITAHVMQKEGLEPSWYHYHTDLNVRVCQFRHFCEQVYLTTLVGKCQYYFSNNLKNI